jgi:hypothetical protein
MSKTSPHEVGFTKACDSGLLFESRFRFDGNELKSNATRSIAHLEKLLLSFRKRLRKVVAGGSNPETQSCCLLNCFRSDERYSHRGLNEADSVFSQ